MLAREGSEYDAITEQYERSIRMIRRSWRRIQLATVNGTSGQVAKAPIRLRNKIKEQLSPFDFGTMKDKGFCQDYETLDIYTGLELEGMAESITLEYKVGGWPEAKG